MVYDDQGAKPLGHTVEAGKEEFVHFLAQVEEWTIKPYETPKNSFKNGFCLFDLEAVEYIKIENFRTIKLSDKILSERLFVRNLMRCQHKMSINQCFAGSTKVS